MHVGPKNERGTGSQGRCHAAAAAAAAVHRLSVLVSKRGRWDCSWSCCGAAEPWTVALKNTSCEVTRRGSRECFGQLQSAGA
jgi:hypothetical protein